MNAVPCLLTLIFCHYFADYVVFDRQTQVKDTHNFFHVGKHLIELFCTFVIGAMVTLNYGYPVINVIKFIVLNTVVHGVTDFALTGIYNAVIIDPHPLMEGEQVTDRKGFWISLAVDQFFHVAAIVVLWDLFLH